jgi:methyl-accepting chemotaxis protein
MYGLRIAQQMSQGECGKGGTDMSEGKTYDRKETKGILRELLTMSLVPLLVAVVLLSVIAVRSMVEGMRTEVMNGLSDLARSVGAAYELVDDGEYSVQDGELYKGSMNLTQAEDIIDSFTVDSDADVTVLYGDTRYVTSLVDSQTGKRITGTKADSEVVDTVVNKGQDYATYDIVVNEVDYYAYYVPLKDSTGQAVGMVFAGEPQSEVAAYIKDRVYAIVKAAVVLLILAIIVSVVFGRMIAGGIGAAERIITTIAQGDLTTAPSPRLLEKRDEIGTMARAIENLRVTLSDVLGDVMTSAEQLSETGRNLDMVAAKTDGTATEISTAVEGISHGALSQATEIDNASHRVIDMGNEIGVIAEKAKTLDEASANVQEAGNVSSEIVNELLVSSNRTVEAIGGIERQILATNESVGRIKNAVSVISDIAAQTNLLSLNASIEAARAGEMGKGFAVVATEISNLAAQSGSSSREIEDIVSRLYEESEKSVEAMNEVKTNIKVQEEKLNDTTRQFAKVEDGIAVSKEETAGISARSAQCNESRQAIVDTMTNLSAISEQNAASTEQTMTSMEALNNTITLLAQEAKNVSDMAESLESKIKVFKL